MKSPNALPEEGIYSISTRLGGQSSRTLARSLSAALHILVRTFVALVSTLVGRTLAGTRLLKGSSVHAKPGQTGGNGVALAGRFHLRRTSSYSKYQPGHGAISEDVLERRQLCSRRGMGWHRVEPCSCSRADHDCRHQTTTGIPGCQAGPWATAAGHGQSSMLAPCADYRAHAALSITSRQLLVAEPWHQQAAAP